MGSDEHLASFQELDDGLETHTTTKPDAPSLFHRGGKSANARTKTQTQVHGRGDINEFHKY